MRYAILASLVVSQLGFVSAYTIFVADNLQAFIMAVTKCGTFVPIHYLIFGQIVVFLPLALIRNIAKLSGTALVADAFILIGLVYIGSNEFATIANRGVAEVALFNPKDFPLLIGYVRIASSIQTMVSKRAVQHLCFLVRRHWVDHPYH